MWEQFVYATDYYAKGQAAVFIEYWLLDWGNSCPSGWHTSGLDCWKNGKLVKAPNVPATELTDEQLQASATSGGVDWAAFFVGTEGYVVSGQDNVLNIATVWNQAEFNVFGDAGGSEASFNPGASLKVHLSLNTEGAAVRCHGPEFAGTTGETNNYLLGSCQAVNQSEPYIQFPESLATAKWETLPSNQTTMLPLTAAVFDGKVFLFSIGPNSHLHFVNEFDGSSWSGWSQVPGGSTTALADSAVVFNGRLYLFAIGTGDHAHYVNSFDGSRWAGWSLVPGGGTTLLADTATVLNGRLYLFGVGIGNGGHYVNSFDGSSWTGWSAVPGGGTTNLSDNAVTYDGRIYLFSIGGNNHEHYVNSFDGEEWAGWSLVPGGGTTALPDASVVFNGRLFLFGIGINSHSHYWNAFDGKNWEGWSVLSAGGETNEAAAAAAFQGQLMLFSVGINSHLIFETNVD